MVRHSTELSVLGAGSKVTGRVSGDGSLRIEGSVRGDVQLNGDAEIASGGSVEGNVQADAVEIGGSLQGDVNARGPVAIRAGAVVRGELKGSEVSIEPGSRISVRLDTELELDLGGSAPKRR
jgi:cytoskeletal protein CcmA (bactofilin family)